jgi:hypothetical protein
LQLASLPISTVFVLWPFLTFLFAMPMGVNDQNEKNDGAGDGENHDDRLILPHIAD